MTPRDSLRCAGWALRLVAWSLLTARGVSEERAMLTTGVRPVRGTWRRNAAGTVLTVDEGGEWRMAAVREWVTAGAAVFAVGTACAWVLAAEREQR